MSIFTRNPEATETPDLGQGGIAVDGITNTGHSATTASAAVTVITGEDSDSETKTARWFSFSGLGVIVIGVRLKFDWSISGSTLESPGEAGSASASAVSRIQYSTNGGSGWTTAVEDSCNGNDSYSSSGSADIDLGASQVISNVQVRDFMQAQASASDAGIGASSASANASITISSIRLEVTIQDGTVIVIM